LPRKSGYNARGFREGGQKRSTVCRSSDEKRKQKRKHSVKKNSMKRIMKGREGGKLGGNGNEE